MENEGIIVQNQKSDHSKEKAVECIDEDKDEYSIYNYIKSHPGSLAVIFSSVVAIITFFAQVTAFVNNKNTLEYWNIDSSYVSWNSNGLLYSALTSIVYVIVVSLLTTWFSEMCDAYLEQKKLFVTCKLICKQRKKEHKYYKKAVSSIDISDPIIDEQLQEVKDCLVNHGASIDELKARARRFEFKAKSTFLLNLLPNLVVLILLSVIRNFIISPKKDLFIGSIVILVIQIVMYWLSFLSMQSITIKKKQIKECINEITPEEIGKLANFKKEYPLLSFLRSQNKISNLSFISQIVQTIIVCTSLIFSLVIIGSSEGSKKTFQTVYLDNQQYVVVYHENETYFLEKALIEGDKLEIYVKDQRIITTSDISFSVITFDEVMKIGDSK